MTWISDFRARYVAQLARLGLDEDMCPYAGLAVDSQEAAEHLLMRMQQLAPGATWRDVYPDMPAHWDLDDPDSWTYPYRPLFPFDYQTLPTGAVCMISCALDAPDRLLDDLLAAAARDGFRIHGAGFIPIANPEWTVREIRMVMQHETTQSELDDFQRWLDGYSGVAFNGISRGIDERAGG